MWSCSRKAFVKHISICFPQRDKLFRRLRMSLMSRHSAIHRLNMECKALGISWPAIAAYGWNMLKWYQIWVSKRCRNRKWAWMAWQPNPWPVVNLRTFGRQSRHSWDQSVSKNHADCCFLASYSNSRSHVCFWSETLFFSTYILCAYRSTAICTLIPCFSKSKFQNMQLRVWIDCRTPASFKPCTV